MAAAAGGVRQMPLTCGGHTRPVVDLAFSPMTSDGFFLISACKDGKPMLRHGMTGDWIGTFEGHKGAVWSARLNATATLAATASADFTAKLWDPISGDELRTFTHPHIVRAVDFAPDSERFVTACNDKRLRLWDVGRADAAVAVLEAGGAAAKAALFVSSATAVSGGSERVLRLWDLRSGQVAAARELDGHVMDIELSRDGRTLTVVTDSSSSNNKNGEVDTVTLWDAERFERTRGFRPAGGPLTASLHPSGDKIAAGGQDFYLHVLDVASGAEREEYKGHHGPVHCVRYSPDGEIYASGSEDGTVRLWQTTVGKEYGLWRVAGEAVAAPAPAGS